MLVSAKLLRVHRRVAADDCRRRLARLLVVTRPALPSALHSALQEGCCHSAVSEGLSTGPTRNRWHQTLGCQRTPHPGARRKSQIIQPRGELVQLGDSRCKAHEALAGYRNLGICTLHMGPNPQGPKIPKVQTQ